MAEIIRNVRGMRDLLDNESRKKFAIEKVARQLALKYGYQEINTPIVEYSSVFNKSRDIPQFLQENFVLKNLNYQKKNM